MKQKSIVAVLALVLHTGVSAHNIEKLLAGIAQLPAENVTASYTMQMPLMDEDVEYMLTFAGDSITATPLNGMPAKTQAISDSPFAAFHPAKIASTIKDKGRGKGHEITHSESDGMVTIVIVNNPASLTEQTITINYNINR